MPYLFVGIAEATDESEVAWRSTGRMIYCLDSRSFHNGSGSNHPRGDRVIRAGDSLRVILNLRDHTLAFALNGEPEVVLFEKLAAKSYVAAVDFRDCGDKVCLGSTVLCVQDPDHAVDDQGNYLSRPRELQLLAVIEEKHCDCAARAFYGIARVL